MAAHIVPFLLLIRTWSLGPSVSLSLNSHCGEVIHSAELHVQGEQHSWRKRRSKCISLWPPAMSILRLSTGFGKAELKEA